MVDLPEFTVQQLLAIPELGLTLLCGREEAQARPVTGAHSIEVESPARWLDRGWIMLTTGIRLPADPAGQRALIGELDAAGVSALGFGVGIVFDEVPAGIRDAAENRGFPLFSVPHDTPFRDVIAAVFRAALSREIRAANRLAAMQRFLLEALGEDSPRVTTIRRLAALIESTVAVIRHDGTVELGTGELPAHEIATQIRARPGAVVHFATAGFHGAAFSLGPPGSASARWLVTAVSAGHAEHALATPAAQATVPLLLAMDQLDRARRTQDLAIGRAALLSALEAAHPHEAPILAARLLACGVDVARGATVVAMRPAGEGALDDLDLLLERVEGALEDAGLTFLGAVHEGRIAGLLPSPVGLGLLERAMRHAGSGAHAGVAQVVDDPLAIASAWAAAVLALESAAGQEASIVRYEDLTLPTVLLNEVPRERLAAKIADWLQPLDGSPAIRETLQAYLDHGFDVVRTARALHLHPNSVRYRLRRAEVLLGASLRSSETIVALHVALREQR